MAHIGCPRRPGYASIAGVFLVGCVMSPYHAETSKQRQRHRGRNMCARPTQTGVRTSCSVSHLSSTLAASSGLTARYPCLHVAVDCSAMWAHEWSDRHWPAEQGAAAPCAPPRALAWWPGHWEKGQSWTTIP